MPAGTSEFVAPGVLDEGGVAVWADAFDGLVDASGEEVLELLGAGLSRGAAADMNVGPGRSAG